MLIRFALLIALLLAFAGCRRESYSRSNSGFSSLDKKILFDFRSTGNGIGTHPDPGTTRKVLSAVFPPYLSDPRQCKTGIDAGQPGQIAPTVRGAAEGSFTAAGLKQSAYLIDVGECDRKPVFASRRLVVFTGGTVTANVQVPMGDAILRTFDLDGNGRQELLLIGGGTGQGEAIESAALVGFDNNKLVTVENFGQIYDDTCDTDLPTKSVNASLVYYLPAPAGQNPRFTVELYRASCAAKGQQPRWSRIGGN